MNYTKQQNNRRYKLHYMCRQRGVGIDIKHATCNVLNKEDINKYVLELVTKYHYVIQFAIYIDDKRVKNIKA